MSRPLVPRRAARLALRPLPGPLHRRRQLAKEKASRWLGAAVTAASDRAVDALGEKGSLPSPPSPPQWEADWGSEHARSDELL